MDKRHREHLKVLEKSGITVDGIRNGRGSHKVIYASYHGRKAVFTSACGMVGHHAETNFDSQVRRFLKECESKPSTSIEFFNTAERKSPLMRP